MMGDTFAKILHRIVGLSGMLQPFGDDISGFLELVHVLWQKRETSQINKLKCVGLFRRLRIKIMSVLEQEAVAIRHKAQTLFDRFYFKYLRRVVVRSGSLARNILIRRLPYIPNIIKQQLDFHQPHICQAQNLKNMSKCKFETLVLFHLDQKQCDARFKETLYECDIPLLDLFVDTLQKHLEQRFIHVTRDLDVAESANTLNFVIESQRLTSMWLRTNAKNDDQTNIWNKRFTTLQKTNKLFYLQLEQDMDEFEDIPQPFSKATLICMFRSKYSCTLNWIEHLFFQR